jgi:hypothetical protein
MSSSRAGIALRPELAQSGWLDTLMGKSLRKIGRDRQGEQLKDVCLCREGGGLGEDLVGLEAGLEANRTCAEEQEYRGRIWCGDRKRIRQRVFPSIYQHTHRNCINPLNYWDLKCH